MQLSSSFSLLLSCFGEESALSLSYSDEVSKVQDVSKKTFLSFLENRLLSSSEKMRFSQIVKFLRESSVQSVASIIHQLIVDKTTDSMITDLLVDFAFENYDVSNFLAKGGSARVITIDGVEILANQLQENGAINFKCTTCRHFDDFKAKLTDLKNEEIPDGHREGIFVKNSAGEIRIGVIESSHITPIYIEKREGELHVVITDSLGHFGYNVFFLTKIIREFLGVTPYSLVIARQVDRTTCPVFSLRDMVQISKNPEFLDFVIESVNEYLKLNVEGKGCYEFDTLPPKMMKITHYLSQIDDIKDVIVRSRKAPAGNEILSEAVLKHVELLENGKMGNALAAKRQKKYEKILIAKCLSEKETLWKGSNPGS